MRNILFTIHGNSPLIAADGAAGLGTGWYRLRFDSGRQSGSRGATLKLIKADGDAASIRIPFGINGKVDHLFRLPFPAKSILFESTADEAFWDGIELNFTTITAPTAWGLMTARLTHYLSSEGDMELLRRVAELEPDFCTSPVMPSTTLGKTYHRIKQTMLLRSLPLSRYREWLDLHAQRFRHGAQEAARKLTGPAAITIIVDARHSARGLAETLSSLRHQSAPNAGCFVAGNVSLRPNSRAAHVNTLEMAVKRATGKYIWFLAPGDTLNRHALLHLSKAAADAPDALCIYADEDRLDNLKTPAAPFFKPDFDPLFQADADYMGRSRIISTHIVRDLIDDGIKPDHAALAELAQNFDADKVVHLPLPLLHAGQQKPVSVATPLTSKATQPHVSIIIPSRDQGAILRTCIKSIVRTTDYPSYDIRIVDNGTKEPDALAYLRELESSGTAHVITADIPFNYATLNNLAAEQAKGEILAFCNNDMEVVSPNWLDTMTNLATKDDISTVGAKLLYPNGTIQHAGLALGLIGIAGHPWKGKQPDAVPQLTAMRTVSANTGACLVMRRELFNAVNGFDEQLAVAFNDVDLCLRLSDKGYRNIWTPQAVLIHHESLSRGLPDTPDKKAQFARERALMVSRWGKRLQADPWYNPNLTRAAEDGGLTLRLPADHLLMR